MTLFSDTMDNNSIPLAARMRPRTLDEVLGQEKLTAAGSVFRKALEGDVLPSLIFHGPPGTGKSTLARLVARHTSHQFTEISAVSAGVKEIREIAKGAADARAFHSQRSILFIDEIHRLNKAQQDQLLPHVESGAFTLIGATTENPYFSIINALLSRCRLFAVERLEPAQIISLMQRALTDTEQGLGMLAITVDADALQHLSTACGGDARAALNALELAALTCGPGAETDSYYITLADAEAAIQQPVLKYDRDGDEHYDTISAFIKSMRGSDPDATVYWLAKMLEAGEDARFIARRIVIQAAEDVGLADPLALRVAIAAADAVEYIGLPEAQIPLSMAAIYVASAPKSNSAYMAINAARQDVRKEGAATVPAHLAGGMRPDDKRSKYLYPHDYPAGWVKQQYLPVGLEKRQYYVPGDNPREVKAAAWLARLRGENSIATGSADAEVNPGINKGESNED